MPEQIYTFSEEEVAKMFKSGEMRVLTTPAEFAQKEKTAHEIALEKAKKLFGKDFEDVFTLQIGGKTVEQLKQELSQANTLIETHTRTRKCILDNPNFIVLSSSQNIELVKITVEKLGFKKPEKIKTIYERALNLGLNLCPAEVGPHLRLQDTNQSISDEYFIAIEPIIGVMGFAHIFYLFNRLSRLWLSDYFSIPTEKWSIKEKFVFSLN